MMAAVDQTLVVVAEWDGAFEVDVDSEDPVAAETVDSEPT